MSGSINLADSFARLAVAPETERHIEDRSSTIQEHARQQRRWLIELSSTGRKTIRYININSKKVFKERVVFRAQCPPSIPPCRLDRSIKARLLLDKRVGAEDMRDFVNLHGNKVWGI
jgi:hypothetical protein